MAAESHAAPSAGEYIVHHLTHLNSLGHKQASLVDWSVFHLDTLFWSITLGLLTVLILARAAAKAAPVDRDQRQSGCDLVSDELEARRAVRVTVQHQHRVVRVRAPADQVMVEAAETLRLVPTRTARL